MIKSYEIEFRIGGTDTYFESIKETDEKFSDESDIYAICARYSGDGSIVVYIKSENIYEAVSLATKSVIKITQKYNKDEHTGCYRHLSEKCIKRNDGSMHYPIYDARMSNCMILRKSLGEEFVGEKSICDKIEIID